MKVEPLELVNSCWWGHKVHNIEWNWKTQFGNIVVWHQGDPNDNIHQVSSQSCFKTPYSSEESMGTGNETSTNLAVRHCKG